MDNTDLETEETEKKIQEMIQESDLTEDFKELAQKDLEILYALMIEITEIFNQTIFAKKGQTFSKTIKDAVDSFIISIAKEFISLIKRENKFAPIANLDSAVEWSQDLYRALFHEIFTEEIADTYIEVLLNDTAEIIKEEIDKISSINDSESEFKS